MLKRTEFSSPDGHVYLKCKTCKQEFYVVSAARYLKTICYCPYCGDSDHKKRYKKHVNNSFEDDSITQEDLDRIYEEVFNYDYRGD